MTIHDEHPFVDPLRQPGRQLRGRLGGRVSLWTSGRCGLTVSSLLVVSGDPWQVVAVLNPEAALTDELLTGGRAALSLLEAEHLRLAEAFAGATPAPGGPFRLTEWMTTDWGPVPAGVNTWAGLELESSTQVGWLTQVVCKVATTTIGDDPDPLFHYRGHYLDAGGRDVSPYRLVSDK